MNLDILKDNFINPALADIISNFAPKDHGNNRKAPATPHNTRAVGGRSERAPGLSEGDMRSRESHSIKYQ